MVRKFSRNISTLFSVILAGNKWLIPLLIVSQLFMGAMPALMLYVIGKAVDNIIHSHYYSLIFLLGIFILLAELSETIVAITSSILSDTAKKNLEKILIDKAALPKDIKHFSNSNFQDVFFLTEKNINEVSNFIIQCSFFVTGLLGLFSIALLLTSLDWWIPLLLILGVVPVVYYKFELEKTIWNMALINVKKFKFLTIAYEDLTRKVSAKELRLNNHVDLLRNKWSKVYSFILKKIYLKRFKGLVKLSLFSLPGIILIVATLYYVVSPTNNKTYNVSQLVILFGSILQIRNQLMIVVANFSSVSFVFFSASTILKLLQFREEIIDRRIFEINRPFAIAVENLSFKYPGAHGFVLENLSFSIRRNTLTVIVAPNGSGKSTLVNIITGLYRDFTGSMKLSVQSAAHVWGVNQNFIIPSLTLREFLDPYRKYDLEAIKETLVHYELGHLVNRLTCYLDARFENFIELSGGQWQRLAMTNVDLNYKEYQLIVLDEINSALDHAGERLYLDLLLKMKKRTTVIIVSHKAEIHAYCDSIIHLAS